MTLSLADWIIIAVYFVVSASIGLYYTKRAGRSLADYFLSGRSLPWWLAGTSMVATTFAADTPLVVTGLVVKYGVAGNWLWWNMALSGLLTVFLFSRLWRRAGVLTDVELVELRYGGRPAAVLRGARALYLAIPINLIIMGWVTKAMADVLEITLGISGWRVAVLLFLITAGYSILSGLWGVVVTDFFQFIIAMGGSILLAVLAVNKVGGIDRLTALAAERYGSHEAALGILPPVDGAWLPLSSLVVFLAVQWWASWYPGAEPDGGGYVAQRIMSAKDERHGLLATLWFNIAHYALRPWPWILVGLFAAVTYPDLTAGGAAAGPLAGGVRGGLHEHDRHAPELGHVVLRQRFLAAIRPPRRGHSGADPRVARRHGGADAARSGGNALPRDHRGGVAPPARHRRGHGAGADPPVVLVARERVERAGGDGRLVGRLGMAVARRGDERRRPDGPRAHRGRDHRRVARRHAPHPPRGARDPGALLSTGAAGRPRLAGRGITARLCGRPDSGRGALVGQLGGGVARRLRHPLRHRPARDRNLRACPGVPRRGRVVVRAHRAEPARRQELPLGAG